MRFVIWKKKKNYYVLWIRVCKVFFVIFSDRVFTVCTSNKQFQNLKILWEIHLVKKIKRSSFKFTILLNIYLLIFDWHLQSVQWRSQKQPKKKYDLCIQYGLKRATKMNNDRKMIHTYLNFSQWKVDIDRTFDRSRGFDK